MLITNRNSINNQFGWANFVKYKYEVYNPEMFLKL